MNRVDVLAITAHPDDAELICGGTLARAVMLGRKAGIVALTAGELGTRGSPQRREQEAEEAGRALGLTLRETVGLPDGGVVNSSETRARLALLIRGARPAVVITHWLKGRHPDHAVTAQLVRDACFVAGLKNVEPGVAPHRRLARDAVDVFMACSDWPHSEGTEHALAEYGALAHSGVIQTERGTDQPALPYFFLERYLPSYIREWEGFLEAVKRHVTPPVSSHDAREPLDRYRAAAGYHC